MRQIAEVGGDTGNGRPQAGAVRPIDLTALRSWSFLSRHAQVLLAVADDPEARICDLTERLGLSERALYRMLSDLQKAGYVHRVKRGRRNHYVVDRRLPLGDPLVERDLVDDLLVLLRADVEAQMLTSPGPASS